MRFARISGIAAVVVVLAASCTSSKLDADAPVRLTGSVVDPSGAPAAGADLGLLKVPDVGELVLGTAQAIGTLGAVCLLDDAPEVCGDAQSSESEADGAFSFSLEGRDTQGTASQASDFVLSAVERRDTGRLVTSVRFRIQRSELAIPPIRLWDAAVDAPVVDGALVPTWPALPAEYGDSPSYGVRFVDGSGPPGATVWAEPETTSGTPVDLRLLEDRTGTVEVGAAVDHSGPDTTFRFTHLAAPAPFAGPGPAPSRGAGCSATTDDGDVVALDPCPLTDGAFFEPGGFSAEGPVRSGAFVDLGAPRPVSLVVARGAIGPVTVETSLDATTWSTAGTSSGSLVAVPLSRPTDARFVRIRTTNGTDVSNLAELSVW